MKVGGAPLHMVEATTHDELITFAREVWDSGEPWLLLGGGSNTVVSDEGFDGTVIRICNTGIEQLERPPAVEDQGAAAAGERVRLRVQAGEQWDGLVALCVRNGWAGIEALSGIPGCVGATPVQNIGAYGQELSSSLVGIEFLDAATGEVRELSAADLELGYRTSVLKRGLAGIVLTVTLDLIANVSGVGAPQSSPVKYAQLADVLGVTVGARVPIAELRRTVLALRASKGMVLDPDDPDSVSAGSFFTNPIVTAEFASTLPAKAPRWPVQPDEPDLMAPLDTNSAENSTSVSLMAQAATERRQRQERTKNHVKFSAAWLIENAGIGRGFALPGSRAGISQKHTLAITNRGGASASEIAQLARYVQWRVQAEFGVLLQAEPVLVGLSL